MKIPTSFLINLCQPAKPTPSESNVRFLGNALGKYQGADSDKYLKKNPQPPMAETIQPLPKKSKSKLKKLPPPPLQKSTPPDSALYEGLLAILGSFKGDFLRYSPEELLRAFEDATALHKKVSDSNTNPFSVSLPKSPPPAILMDQLQIVEGKVTTPNLSHIDLSGYDLRGLDFSGVNLKGANLKGALLTDAHFNNAILDGADLSQADLRHADLTQVQMKRVKLDDADLRQARLMGANLTEAVLQGAKIHETDFTEAIMHLATLPLDFRTSTITGADMKAAKLQSANFASTDLRKVKFYNTHFYDANLSGADLSGQTLEYCNFSQVNLDDVTLNDAKLDHCTVGSLNNASCERTKFSFSVFKPGISRSSNFNHAEFCFCQFEQSEFDTCSFAQSTISNCGIKNNAFRGCDFKQAQFLNARAEKTTFSDVDFTNALLSSCFYHSHFSNVNFRDTATQDLTVFTRCTFQNTPMKSLFDLDRPSVKDRIFITSATVDQASMRDVSLTGRNLSGFSFKKFDFGNQDLTDTDLSEADLTEADLSKAVLNNTDFSNANLSCATIGGNSLSKAKLVKVKLPQVDLSGADLKGVDLSKADLTDAVLSSAKLAGANLENAILKSTRLNGADLQGANLASALISDCDLTETSIQDADFRWASIVDCNLSGQDLRKLIVQVPALLRCNLSKVDLSHIDCSNKIFSNSTMNGADLSHSNFSGAKLDGVQGQQIVCQGTNFSKSNLKAAVFSEGDFAGATLDKAYTSAETVLPAGVDTSECKLLNEREFDPAGVAGLVRSEADGLTSEAVIKVLENRMKMVSSEEVASILSVFPEAERSQARQVMLYLSQYGNLNGLGEFSKAVDANGVISKDRMSFASLGEVMYYLSYRKSVIPGLYFNTGGQQLILDEMTLQQLEQDTELRQDILDRQVELSYPAGWIGGINLFNQGDTADMQARVKVVFDRAKQIMAEEHCDFMDAVRIASIEPVKERLKAIGLDQNLHVFENENVITVGEASVSDETIVDSLSQKAMSLQDLEELLASSYDEDRSKSENVGKGYEQYRQYVLEYIVQEAHPYTYRVLTAMAKQHYARIKEMAQNKGVPEDKIYFYVGESSKSYGLMTMLYALANNIPVNRILNKHNGSSFPLVPESLPDDIWVVAVDDIAGSGHSLEGIAENFQAEFPQSQLVIAPVFSTPQAQDYIESSCPSVLYVAAEYLIPFHKGAYYSSLSLPDKMMFDVVRGNLGYGETDACIGFPQMQPDNNCDLGEKVMDYFVLEL